MFSHKTHLLKWQGLKNIAFPLRIFLLLLVFSVVLIGALDRFLTHSFEQYLVNQVSKMAMNQAKIVASMDSVVDAVKKRDQPRLASIVERLGSSSDFDYIVIGDEHSQRLYHPNPAKIGLPMQWSKTWRVGARRELHYLWQGFDGKSHACQNPDF